MTRTITTQRTARETGHRFEHKLYLCSDGVYRDFRSMREYRDRYERPVTAENRNLSVAWSR